MDVHLMDVPLSWASLTGMHLPPPQSLYPLTPPQSLRFLSLPQNLGTPSAHCLSQATIIAPFRHNNTNHLHTITLPHLLP
jgi:hypothetical protein